MIASFKRFFAKQGIDRDLSDICRWAQRRGHDFKRARGDDGFVIDGILEGKPWRIEWGPPQRSYIEGHELRVRMELDLPGELEMMLLSRQLMNALEHEAFEDFTDKVQTQINSGSPEEMRWLVMFPKVDLTTLTTLQGQFGAVASSPAAGLFWIEGPVAHLLEEAANGFLRHDPPFVLMTLRGRVYLRMQLASPDSKAIAAALAVFETAVAQAVRASCGMPGDGAAQNSSVDTAWQNLNADKARDPRKRH